MTLLRGGGGGGGGAGGGTFEKKCVWREVDLVNRGETAGTGRMPESWPWQSP